MLFNSYAFVFGFLPVALVAYAWLRRLTDPRPLLAALLVLSLAFYALWDWRLLPLLLASIACNAWIAGRMARAVAIRGRRVWLRLGLAVNLGLLFACKYAGAVATLAAPGVESTARATRQTSSAVMGRVARRPASTRPSDPVSATSQRTLCQTVGPSRRASAASASSRALAAA